MSLVLFVATAVAMLVLVYPYVIYPLLLGSTRQKPIAFTDAPAPSATLVFCAYNEQRSIPAKIQNLRDIRAAWPDIKFACYVDKSSDRTLELLNEHRDLIDVYAATERTGKAVGMTELATRRCDTDIMIFTDANVMVKPDDIPTLLRYFSDPTVGGVCGKLVYTNPDDSLTAATSSFYWQVEERIKRGESRSGSTMGADGSLFATRRKLYPKVPAHLLDDLISSMAVVFAGYRLVSAPDVHAYEQAVVLGKEEFRRRRRIACRAYNSHRYLSADLAKMSRLDRWKYVSHRVVRWYGFPTFVIALLLGEGFLWSALGLLPAIASLAAIVGILVLATQVKVPVVSRVLEVLSLLWATLLGILDAGRGETYQTWQPAQTREAS